MSEAIPTPIVPVAAARPRSRGAWRFIIPPLAIVAWWIVYSGLEAAASWLTFTALRLVPRTPLASAVEFVSYETPKVLMLLVLVVFGVGIVRSFILRKVLTKRLIAVFVGVVAAGIVLVGYLFNLAL